MLARDLGREQSRPLSKAKKAEKMIQVDLASVTKSSKVRQFIPIFLLRELQWYKLIWVLNHSFLTTLNIMAKSDEKLLNVQSNRE